uniref:Non-specific serine/threonine protein kinase n=1 Tax=Timema shepardi TaxID=629360 RepID=A0A7R9FVU7_TIMSH|nr:unnamed protein product [Timema shepardi]
MNDIEWPDEEDWPVQQEAKDIITTLLQQNPRERLGTSGPQEVKEHPYFDGVDWNSLLRQKAEFVPQIDHEEDTNWMEVSGPQGERKLGYFRTQQVVSLAGHFARMDRYNHDIGEDTDDTDESPLFGSFSSCSPQYRKVQTRLGPFDELEDGILRKSFSRGDSGQSDHSESSPSNFEGNPDTPEIEGIHDLSERKVANLSTPESSQTESDDVSPQIQRKRRLHSKEALPRFSISVEDNQISMDLYSLKDGPIEEKSSRCAEPPTALRIAFSTKHRSRTVIKSASASGLSLMIPSEFFKCPGGYSKLPASNRLAMPVLDESPPQSVQSPGGSSTASSRDTSPCRELSPLVTSLNPPIIIRRGPRGFGFTVHTIRVYYGDTDFYTMHHLVMVVDNGSPAFESGVQPGDLITHINGEAVQGLYHTQVLQLLLSGGDHVTIRSTPLENTSIRSGGRKREPWQSKLARRSMHRQRRQKRDHTDKRRKSSLFRRISSKRASVEMQQPIKVPGPLSAPILPVVCVPQFMRSHTESLRNHCAAVHTDTATYLKLTDSYQTKPFVGLSLTTHHTLLLATALVHVTTPSGNTQIVRAILDSTSQSTLIIEHCAQMLGVKRNYLKPNNVLIVEYGLLKSLSPHSSTLAVLTWQRRSEASLKIGSILGLKWKHDSDAFLYKIDIVQQVPTKRSVLFAVAQIYDPCGLLTPVVFWAKSLMQLLRTLGLSWDEPLPADISERWTAANSTLPSMATPSRSFQSIPRALVSQDVVSGPPPHAKVLNSPPTNRITFSSPEPCLSPANSSHSSSPSSSTPNSPAGVPSNSTVHYQRPSTLHGLKHKLHSAAKSIHSPNRRKSVGHIPLSPLARTPSPSPLPSSPTRSPSPLAFPVGHHPGSSNTTQSYSPGTSFSYTSKKSYGRPKSAEPGSPLLRRALSPDRLHPRSAESKVKSSSSSISPLCNPDLKVTVSAAPRVTITSQSPPIPSRSNYTNLTDKPITSKPPEHPSAIRPEKEGTLDKLSRFIEPYQRPEIRDKRVTVDILPSTSAKKISVDESPHPKSGSIVPTCDRNSQHLPRIAEEKDSPTGSKDDTTSKDLLKEVQNSTLDCILLGSRSNEVNTKFERDFIKLITSVITISSDHYARIFSWCSHGSNTAFCKGQKQYPIGRKLGAVSETKEEDTRAVISKCLDTFKMLSEEDVLLAASANVIFSVRPARLDTDFGLVLLSRVVLSHAGTYLLRDLKCDDYGLSRELSIGSQQMLIHRINTIYITLTWGWLTTLAASGGIAGDLAIFNSHHRKSNTTKSSHVTSRYPGVTVAEIPDAGRNKEE